jgi:rRNA maturation RNase YbeY
MHSASSKLKVRFFFQKVKINLSNRTTLKTFIASIFKKEGKRLESINYIFCSDNALLKINRQFLKHDYYTDIITFDFSENSTIRGEVYISIDRIKDNARHLGVSIESELLRVVFHGSLHLCGYKDKTPKDKCEIRKKEDYYLNSYLNK